MVLNILSCSVPGITFRCVRAILRLAQKPALYQCFKTVRPTLNRYNWPMKVVILCGGLGTRMREETEFRPKPLVDVGGRTVLWHIMKTYAHHGFRDFILCLGYRGNMIKDYFLNYEAMNNDFRISLGSKSHIEFMGAHQEQDFSVTLADTGLETMTGGRLQSVGRYLADDDTFLLTYGDGLRNVHIPTLIAFP